MAPYRSKATPGLRREGEALLQTFAFGRQWLREVEMVNINQAQKNWLIIAAPYTENLGLGKKRFDLKSQITGAGRLLLQG